MSDRLLVFDSIISLSALTAILIMLAIFIVFLEWKRSSPYRILRITASAFIIAGFFGIFSGPSLSKKTNSPVILITENHSRAKLDSLQKANPQAQVTAVGENTDQPNSFNALSIVKSDVDYVLGNGLSPGVLDLLKGQSFQYYRSDLPEGIIDLQLLKEIFVNQPATISGLINTSKPQKLVLSIAGDKLDSIEIQRKGIQPFTVTFTPKQAGKFLYVLKNNEASDTIPVIINQDKKLKILFLQEAPTFESKYLKNFLSEKHRLIVRYQLSKNKFRYEFSNQAEEKIDRLNSKMLSDFDLLIVDSDFLNNVSSDQQKAIDESINNGIGLIILGNDKNLGSDKISKFTGIRFLNYQGDTVAFRIKEKTFTLPVIGLNMSDITHPTVKNKNRILTGIKSKGLGNIGIQLLQETYQLQLQSDSLAYAQLWTDLIQQTSRTEMKPTSIQLTNQLPIYPDDPLTFKIVTIEKSPSIFLDSVQIPLDEDFYFDDVYHAKNWAGNPGWHTLTTTEGDSTETHFFVSSNQSLKSLRVAHKMASTIQQSSTQSQEVEQSRIVNTKISPLIFLMLILAGAAILWVVPKL